MTMIISVPITQVTTKSKVKNLVKGFGLAVK
jgi:hypothetical protein